MSNRQKHNLIRQRLAMLGYHVRCEAGKPLVIELTPKQAYKGA
ncbi:MAG: hypothetical protein Pars93KO_27610 [Parasphingorhabdus sp.]